MSSGVPNRIFARVPEPVGRGAEIERICRYSTDAGPSHDLWVLAKPGAGTSEILRQAYDKLFFSQREIAPVYFEFIRGERSVRDVATRFLSEFLTQTIAFRTGDAAHAHNLPSVNEIIDLAPPADRRWIDDLVRGLDRETDLASFVRRCLTAPLRAAAAGVDSVVMLDGLVPPEYLNGEDGLGREILDIASRSTSKFVISGPRRALFGGSSVNTLRIGQLQFADAAAMTGCIATRLGVEINDETRDLAAIQLNGNAAYISLLLTTAAERCLSLTDFTTFEALYADEISGGRIARYIDDAFHQVLPESLITPVLSLLSEALKAGDGVELDRWRQKLDRPDKEFRRLVAGLHLAELVNVHSGLVYIDPDDLPLRDRIKVRGRIEVERQPRAPMIGSTVIDQIQRAPRLMAATYRKQASIGLREVLSSFDGQSLPRWLFDHSLYKANIRGRDEAEVLRTIGSETDRIELPRIAFSAHTSTFTPRLRERIETERSAIGLGFFTNDRKPTAWLAVEVDSKLEATRDVAEFWCDRLEAVALEHEFDNYRLWLVAPEGFDDDAMAALDERQAFGSNKKQIELLKFITSTDTPEPEPVNANEYEFVVPMGEDSEIVAARAVEDIARKHTIPQKAINQVKTALVEACINAAEHSLSPDRKIHLKFAIRDDRLMITVSNRGLRLADKQGREVTDGEGRRGWGLKLMRGLMDDVRIEDIDDGTRITMTKNIVR